MFWHGQTLREQALNAAVRPEEHQAAPAFAVTAQS
jgi:hypothetical protein